MKHLVTGEERNGSFEHRSAAPRQHRGEASSDLRRHEPLAADAHYLGHRERQLTALRQAGLTEEEALAEFGRMAAGDIWGG